MITGDRTEAMGARLDRTAERLGVGEAGRDLMDRAFKLSLALRSKLDSDHPDVLHTARTALILMDDLEVVDADLLAAALVLDTRDPDLAPSGEQLESLAPAVRDLVNAVPLPRVEGGRLLEALLALPPEVAMLALAERLDHARHLHLGEPDQWRTEHTLTCQVYGPVAPRVHPVLTRRFAWWCQTFERRFHHG